MKRQQTRRLLIFISLLLFPLFMNYLSPYLIVNGAFEGVLAGSAIAFLSQFLFSMITGRLFCGWLCPMAGLGEALTVVNGKRVTSRAVKRMKFIIWAVWLCSIFGGFIAAGGLKVFNPLYMTESGISVDEPMRYFIYYSVILVFLLLSVFVGRRAACHSICWMAPFMILGKNLSDLLHLPRLKVRSDKESCIKCKKCIEVCPMSIEVMNIPDERFHKTDDCILCGMCVDNCPKRCFSYRIK